MNTQSRGMQAAEHNTGQLTRCPWAESDELSRRYHDEEWGVPRYDPGGLFELLVLEGMQAGLSWRIILAKRTAIREALSGLRPEPLARLDDQTLERLCMHGRGIIRNRAKLFAARNNARAWVALSEQHDPVTWLWQFVDGAPIINNFESAQQVPAETQRSSAMAKELRKQGFRFVGPVICYAYMQSVGMVNDHLVSCFRHQACIDMQDALTAARKSVSAAPAA